MLIDQARASFCKCTCKTNSTIIALDTPPDTPNIDPGTSDSSNRDIVTGGPTNEGDDQSTHHQRTCADCNRQFCLSYDLPKLDDCKVENRGREDEIVATCFQRDSAKDQAVVYTFMIVTVGLLVWAGVRPYVHKRAEVSGLFFRRRCTPIFWLALYLSEMLTSASLHARTIQAMSRCLCDKAGLVQADCPFSTRLISFNG